MPNTKDLQTLSNRSVQLQEAAQTLLQLAQKKGASAAQVNASAEQGYSLSVRLGEIESLEFHRNKAVQLTVYDGHKSASVSTSDLALENLNDLTDKAIFMAKQSEADPFAGLPDKKYLAFNYPELSLYFPWDLSPDEALVQLIQAEKKGLEYNNKISNSEGASLSTGESYYLVANSDGFLGSYLGSSHSMGVSFVAKENDKLQRDHDYTVARDYKDLKHFDDIARKAAKKTVERLGAKSLATQKSPIIFMPEVARSLIGHFTRAISGSLLFRQASFLCDSLGQSIFPDWLSLREFPHLPKAIASIPFDADGLATIPMNIVEAGRLNAYLLDVYAARKLNLEPNAHASGINNLILEAPLKPLETLLKTMHKGFLVTELMGQGVNSLTGDYSRAAAGFWVENGKIQYPVQGVTIAGNLRNIFKGIELCGEDIDLRSSIQTGSLLINEMMIAGEES